MMEAIKNKLWLVTAVTILLMYTGVQLRAQKFSKDFWHFGEVEFKDGSTMVGKIKYNLDAENVQLNVKNKVKSFSATTVAAFQINDTILGYTRYFFSLSFADEENYEKDIFFELLVEGPISLLAREKITEEVVGMYDPYSLGNRGMIRLVQVDDFFILDENFMIKPLGTKEKEVVKALHDHAESIERYIDKNKLKLELREDMAMVFDYYNSLRDF